MADINAIAKTFGFFFVIVAVTSIFVICNEMEHDTDLLLLSRTGQKFRTAGSQCPFGSYFYKGPQDVDCVCSKGLWVFFESSCGPPLFLQGSKYLICTPVEFQVEKSLLISTSLEPSFAVLNNRDGISVKLLENSLNIPFKLVENELIVVSGQWTMELMNGQEATIGHIGNFCVYDSSELMGERVISVLVGSQISEGKAEVSNWKPVLCADFLLDSSSGTMQECTYGRKRYPRSPFTPSSNKRGRAFLPAIIAMNDRYRNEVNGTQEALLNSTDNGTYPIMDEDLENVTVTGNPIIKSQIWNYLTEKATDMLGLLEIDPRQARKTKIPAFRFLDLCKEIMQRRCPEHYVPTSHWDMSVATFRAIQLRDFLYEEPHIQHEQVERIVKTLQICRDETNETFPFTTANQTCNDTNPPEPGLAITENPLDTVGQFFMFDQELFLDIPYSMSPHNREPIIDTVWNVFFHAHSHCFKFFQNSSYNDHHLFSTTMMSLFTNRILELWTEVTELKPDIYSGFLGDAVVLMQRVVHCAASGRLDNETTYPWDLQRPGSGMNTTTAPQDASSRRKRHVHSLAYEDYPQGQVGCISAIQENSFLCLK